MTNMDYASSGLRLHHIGPKMSFGFTDYVPEEETRNLRTNFPEPDMLQAFKEITSERSQDLNDAKVETKERINKEVVDKYCKQMSNSTLSHPNYRFLPWQTNESEYYDNGDSSGRDRSKKILSPTSNLHSGKKESLAYDVTPSVLEEHYRLNNSIPFCLQPDAAYLMQQTALDCQKKKAMKELGTCVFYLNDRKHMKSLESRLSAGINRKVDREQQKRSYAEYIKTRKILSEDLECTCSVTQKCNDSRLKSKKRLEKRKSGQRSTSKHITSEIPLDEGGSEIVTNKSSAEKKSSEKIPEESQPVSEVSATEATSPPEEMDARPSRSHRRISMNGLYREAEEMVHPLGEFEKRTLKYKNLSWQR